LYELLIREPWTYIYISAYHSKVIKALQLQNYRNLETLSADFNTGVNIVVAPNGSGKTNLLESIYFTSYNKVFRTIENTKQLVTSGKEYSRVTAQTVSQSELEKHIDSNGKITSFLNKKSTLASKLSEKMPCILFAPSSVNLVDGDPSVRRDDLDAFLSKVDVEYKYALTEYKRILKQRNALLKLIKEGKSNGDSMEFWDNKIINLSHLIYTLRIKYLDILNVSSSEIELERYTPVNMKYTEHLDVERFEDKFEGYRAELERKITTGRTKEVSAGKTLYGAHRDEISIYMNSIELRYLGSRGQQRIGAFIYKLTQHFLLKKLKEESPVFLIDDLMSELDNRNREICGKIISMNVEQSILTTADDSEIDDQTKSVAKFIRVGEQVV
jgi:DNA replication and repair protein RecF